MSRNFGLKQANDNEPDVLAPSRGIVRGLFVGLIMWAIFISLAIAIADYGHPWLKVVGL